VPKTAVVEVVPEEVLVVDELSLEVEELLSSLLAQEKMVKIKKDIKKKFTILFIFPLFRNEKNRLVLLMYPFVIHQYTYVLHIHLY